MTGPPRALVADDEPSIRFVLRETLAELGWNIRRPTTARARSRRSRRAAHALAFLDIRMPSPSGLELLDRVQSLGHRHEVVIITAQNSFENAVEAMKRGALDYLVKPFGMDEVKALAAGDARELEREVKGCGARSGGARRPGERLVGKSAAISRCSRRSGASRRATCRCSSRARAEPGRSWWRARSTPRARAPRSRSSR